MKSPAPSWQIARTNLRAAPYIAAVGGVLAALLLYRGPIDIAYLVLAVCVGVLAFLVQWFGLRHRTYLGPVSGFLMIFAFMLGREFLLPPDVDRTLAFFWMAQFVCSCLFSFAISHLVFRKQLRRDLETYAA
jgi:hypothetical protein